MNKLLYLLYFSIFFIDYLHTGGILPRCATWFPELLALSTLVMISLLLAYKKNFAINKKYIILIVLYLTIIFIGFSVNTIPVTSVIIGARVYLKYLPFFLLPAVYPFSNAQLKKQLQIILPLILLQCPLALYQKFFRYKGIGTGDVIAGTINNSSVLSITMVCSIALLFALYLKKKIGLKFFLVVAFVLFVPTTLNESKSIFILLPVALIVPALFSKEKKISSKLKNLFTMAVTGVLFMSVFISVYDCFWGRNQGILDFFNNRSSVTAYLYQGLGEKGGQGKEIKRGDTIVLAYKHLSKNPIQLAFGLGIGEITRSYFGSISGDKAERYHSIYGAQRLSLTNMLWEIGILGTIAYVTFLYFVLKDALLLKEYDDLFGSLALGWCPVVIIMAMCLLYLNIIHWNVTGFIFWYFSGLIASRTFKLSHEMEKRALDPKPIIFKLS